MDEKAVRHFFNLLDDNFKDTSTEINKRFKCAEGLLDLANDTFQFRKIRKITENFSKLKRKADKIYADHMLIEDEIKRIADGVEAVIALKGIKKSFVYGLENPKKIDGNLEKIKYFLETIENYIEWIYAETTGIYV